MGDWRRRLVLRLWTSDDAASLATTRHAQELGVNWIDTAAVYGLGHSEELVGSFSWDCPSPPARWSLPSADSFGMSVVNGASSTCPKNLSLYGLSARPCFAGWRPIARRHDTTVYAVATAWVLSWHGVTGAIVGARSPEQVDGWIQAAALELPAFSLK